MLGRTIEESEALSRVLDDLDKSEGKHFESLCNAIETGAGRKRIAADLTELETVETDRRR
jgi:hypothetical protein